MLLKRSYWRWLGLLLVFLSRSSLKSFPDGSNSQPTKRKGSHIESLFCFIPCLIFSLTSFLQTSKTKHISKERRKKPEKKEKRKPLACEACRVVKVFWKNTTRPKKGGDFFKNPKGLTLIALQMPNYFCFHFLFFGLHPAG